MTTDTRLFSSGRAALAGIVLALSPAVPALSPPPPMPVEALTDFYEAMNGDDWHRNDGWLDPDVDVCDWYGITCVTEEPESGGFEWIGRIELPNNNLHGEFTAGLLERMRSQGPPTPSVELDLRGNAIEGALHQLPTRTRRVRLGYNRFDGQLPAVDAETVGDALEYLELNNNRFEGPIPSSWEALSLIKLDVSNNALEGSAESAFSALDPAEASLIDLADNAFAGELPAWITELPLKPDFGGIGSVNICWTELSAADQEVHDWLAERHVGGPDFESCMQRQRRSIGPRVSGSWYDPARSGEGYSVMLLENGDPLVYWFTHLSASRQMWLIGTGRHEDTTLFFPELLRTEGRFGQGLASIDHPVSRKGEQRMDGVGDDRLHISALTGYSTTDLAQPGDGPIVYMPNPLDWRTDLARLSELAGTTCGNQSEFQRYSGAWYSPERSGEGFIVEVLPDNRAVVYWFTYLPDESGRQAWMIGQARVGGLADAGRVAIIEIDPLLQPIDTDQTFPGDLSGVEALDWGELTLAFEGEDSGRVVYDSNFPEYGNGDYPIERLARPMLADCD